MAEAPSLKSSRVQTLKELDQEIDRALPPASEIGVDLSALMRFLTPAPILTRAAVVVLQLLGPDRRRVLGCSAPSGGEPAPLRSLRGPVHTSRLRRVPALEPSHV